MRVVAVNDPGLRRLAAQVERGEGSDGDALQFGFGEEEAVGAGEKAAVVAETVEAVDQVEELPLASAKGGAGIEVQDAQGRHQLMKRAFAYLRKV
jgi:hypothetical protein